MRPIHSWGASLVGDVIVVVSRRALAREKLPGLFPSLRLCPKDVLHEMGETGSFGVDAFPCFGNLLVSGVCSGSHGIQHLSIRCAALL